MQDLWPHAPAVAVAAIHCGHVAEIDRVLEVETGQRRDVHGVFLLFENRVADGAILPDRLALGADMIAVVAAETAAGVKVPDVIRVGPPI